MRLTALFAVVIGGVLWGPRIISRFQVLYWQYRCMAHPSLTDDPAARRAPADVPYAWARFYQIVSPPGIASDGTVFLGRRVAADGSVRLIAVDVNGVDSPHGARATARVFVPGGVLVRPREVPQRSGSFPLPPGARAVAGVADPDDPSHFTFSYLIEGREHFVDGWLRAGDELLLEVRR